jgi:hypothetical protein
MFAFSNNIGMYQPNPVMQWLVGGSLVTVERSFDDDADATDDADDDEI